MLIKGKIIPKNHKKVLKLINERYKQQDPVFLFLYGKILKQQMKYKESISYFEKAVEEGDDESLYELGKVILIELLASLVIVQWKSSANIES